MSKEPIEYLKHIKDECSFILSVIPEDFTKDEFIASETLKRAVVRPLVFVRTFQNLAGIDEYVDWCRELTGCNLGQFTYFNFQN